MKKDARMALHVLPLVSLVRGEAGILVTAMYSNYIIRRNHHRIIKKYLLWYDISASPGREGVSGSRQVSRT